MGGMCGVVEERSWDQLEEGGRSGRSCWLLIQRKERILTSLKNKVDKHVKVLNVLRKGRVKAKPSVN